MTDLEEIMKRLKRSWSIFKEKYIRIKVADLPTTMMDIPVGQERIKINTKQQEGIAIMLVMNGKSILLELED